MDMTELFLNWGFIALFLSLFLMIFLCIVGRRDNKKIIERIKILEADNRTLRDFLTVGHSKLDEIRLQIGIISGTIIRTIHVSEPAPLGQIPEKRGRGRPPKKIEKQTR